MLNAHNALMLAPSSRTSRELSFARTANIFSPFRVESANIKKSTNLENFGNGANRGGVLGSRVVLPEDYVPNDKEEFMNEMQLEYFRQKLLNWKYDLLNEANDTKDTLSAEGLQRPDIADRAQVESDASIQLRTRDRERKLISKIDAALRRIDLKTYGYCEETGDPIGLGRLEARPIASLSVDAQERHEKMEKVHKDD
jgi:DnaK suppressor protein